MPNTLTPNARPLNAQQDEKNKTPARFRDLAGLLGLRLAIEFVSIHALAGDRPKRSAPNGRNYTIIFIRAQRPNVSLFGAAL